MNDLRAKAAAAGHGGGRVSLAVVFSHSASHSLVRRLTDLLAAHLREQGMLADTLAYAGPNLVVIDGSSRATDDELRAAVYDYALTKSHVSEISPDIWEPAVIRDPEKAREALTRAAAASTAIASSRPTPTRSCAACSACPSCPRSRAGACSRRPCTWSIPRSAWPPTPWTPGASRTP